MEIDWTKILIYAFILISLFIYVKLSSIRVNGVSPIKLHWRILLAVFFPVVFIILFLFGAVILAIVLSVLFIILLSSIFARFYYSKKKKDF